MQQPMQTSNDKESRFLQIIDKYAGIIKRVCLMFSTPALMYDDLYQETILNLWRGFDGFRGDAKISTWIYTTTFNTCITWQRRNNRHRDALPLEVLGENVLAHTDSQYSHNLAELYRLISHLNPLEKAIIMMWLDDKSYEEIGEVTGLNRNVVATRLHRIKNKLKAMSD